jgi:hypothetical protein
MASTFEGLAVQYDGSSSSIGLFQTGTTYTYGAVGSSESWIYSSNRSITLMADGGSAILKFATGGNTERMRIDSSGNLLFNSGYGSVATAYGCRAWVNFDGIGTVAIRASGNVSSVTDNGTGQYTVNFSTAMPDTNYAGVQNNDWFGLGYLDTYLTSSIKIYTINNDWTPRDIGTISVAIFR